MRETTGRYNAVTIELKDRQTGYDAIEEYILRYWEHNAYESVIVTIAVSYNGRDYVLHNEVVWPSESGCDMEFLHDWWEGERFIKIFAIEAVGNLTICGGIYEE